MTTLKKRSRMGVAVATAVLSMASVFALAGTASAAPTPPNPPENVTATGGQNQITVKWNPTSLGGGTDPTDYVIFAELAAGPLDSPIKVAIVPYVAGQTEYVKVIDGLPAGTYRIRIRAHNAAALDPLLYANSSPVTVQPIVVTAPVTIVSTGPFRPYANWDALIKREYQMWTGCNATGRLPRLDELTFWRFQIADKPFSADEDVQWTLDTTTPVQGPGGGAINVPTFYRSALDALYYPASRAGVEAAYAGSTLPYTYVSPAAAPFALADTNQDGKLDLSEVNAAHTSAHNTARNNVFFSRRAAMSITLAEGAEQTDGPAIRLYTAYFKRDADLGACYWSNQIKSSKMSLLGVSNFFVNSSEFVNTYGAYTTDAAEPGTDAAEFVALIYANVLNRDPDATGFAYWTRQLQSQRKNPAEVMIGFSEASEFKNKRSLSTGVAVAYFHLLGRAPTAAEYVYSDIFNLFLNTSPECGWSFWGCYASAFDPIAGAYRGGYTGQYALYQFLIGTPEYVTRAAAAS